MSTQAGFALRGRNPDVLTCIANLSNDEVFTPPEFANRMLDTLAEACLRLGVSPPPGDAATQADIYRTEAALAARGLDVRHHIAGPRA